MSKNQLVLDLSPLSSFSRACDFSFFSIGDVAGLARTYGVTALRVSVGSDGEELENTGHELKR